MHAIIAYNQPRGAARAVARKKNKGQSQVRNEPDPQNLAFIRRIAAGLSLNIPLLELT
jgi:hypothetical protein